MDGDYGHYPVGDDGDWSINPDEIENEPEGGDLMTHYTLPF